MPPEGTPVAARASGGGQAEPVRGRDCVPDRLFEPGRERYAVTAHAWGSEIPCGMVRDDGPAGGAPEASPPPQGGGELTGLRRTIAPPEGAMGPTFRRAR